MTELLRPYARTNPYADVITPADVHTWAAQRHTELEWQARERVLVDQRRDARTEQRFQAWLTRAGACLVPCMSVIAVLAFSLTHRDPDGNVVPGWAVLVAVFASVLVVTGLVAVWFGAIDWHGYRLHERIAERALREHHLAYVARG